MFKFHVGAYKGINSKDHARSWGLTLCMKMEESNMHENIVGSFYNVCQMSKSVVIWSDWTGKLIWHSFAEKPKYMCTRNMGNISNTNMYSWEMDRYKYVYIVISFLTLKYEMKRIHLFLRLMKKKKWLQRVKTFGVWCNFRKVVITGCFSEDRFPWIHSQHS